MKRVGVLLRAVNVGGTGKLAMSDFKATLAALGYGAPQTLGAAGSAVVDASDAAETVEADVAAALAARCGLVTEALARGHDEFAEVIAANPFTQMADTRPSGLVVLFLKGRPEPAAVEALRGRIQGPEEVAPGPRSLFIAYGEAMGRSKLTGAVIERALGLRGTGRNFNTVRKLVELTRP